jgi:hypothetical protein
MGASAHDRSGHMRWDAAIESMPPHVKLTSGESTRHEQAAPERRLLLAVLVDAIVRVRRLPGPSSHAVRRAGVEAERWIRSDDRSWPCSFVNVCDALDLAYQPLRRAVLCAGPSAAGVRDVREARRLTPRRNAPRRRWSTARPEAPAPYPQPRASNQ